MIAKGTPWWIFIMPLLSLLALVSSILFGDVRTLLFITGMVLFILSFPVVLFFRDPSRDIGNDIVSPADGKVMFVDRCEVDTKWHIAIFMSPLNVHVNRAPLGGRVVEVKHIEGSFIPAFDKESEKNERVVTKLMTDLGEITIIQIAGIVARRIVPYIKRGIRLRKGQRMGMIRFGSRVDIYLPSALVEPTLVPGQRVKAGRDTIGVIKVENK